MHYKTKLTLKDMLEKLDDDYQYTRELLDYPDRDFADLNSRRDLSDDLDQVIKFMDFQAVYVGGRYATSKEIELYLLKKKKKLQLEGVGTNFIFKRKKPDLKDNKLFNLQDMKKMNGIAT